MTSEKDSISEKNKTYRRLLQTLDLISLNSNLSYRIAFGNGIESLEKIWKEHHAPWQALRAAIEHAPMEELPVEYDLDIRLWKWFFPLWNYESLNNTDRKKAFLLEEEIKAAIWKIRHSIGNPLHEALTHTFPFLRVFARLQMLKIVATKRNIAHPQIVTNPTGLSRVVLSMNYLPSFDINTNDLFFVGSVLLHEKHEHIDAEVYNLKREEYVKQIILRCVEKNDMLGRVLNTKTKKISFESTSHLLTASAMHSALSGQQLKQSSLDTEAILKLVDTLYVNNESFLFELHASEWQSLIEFILFIRDSKTRTLLENIVMQRIIKEVNNNDIFRITRLLSGRKDRNYAIMAECDKENFSKQTESKWYPGFHCFVPLVKSIRTEGYPLLFENSGKNDTEEIESQYRYLNLTWKLRRSELRRLEYENLQYSLSQLKADELDERYQLIFETIRRIVSADKVMYFEYNGFSDLLEPVYLSRDKILRSTQEKEARETEKALKEIKNIFINIGKDGFPKREDSSAYRSIDRVHLISRFEGDDLNPFASRVKDSVDSISPQLSSYFSDEKESLAIPIMFYGRKQGVLHLGSVLLHQYQLIDRIDLINAVHMFEEEIFRSHFLKRLNNIHLQLAATIQKSNTEETFLHNIADEIGRLLGATGVSIWWQNRPDQTELKIIAVAGEKIKSALGRGVFVNLLRDNFFRSALDQDDVAYIDDVESLGSIGRFLKQANLHSCIQAIMKDDKESVIGALVVHDCLPDSFSKPFLDEFVFISKEIQGILQYYFEHQGQIENIQLFFAHDINSAITRIRSNARRLAKYRDYHNISDTEKVVFQERINDILQNAQVAHSLFVKLTSGNLSKDTFSIANDSLLQHKVHLDDHSKSIEPENVRELIKQTLFSKRSEFQRNLISFSFPPITRLDLELKIAKIDLDRIFNNLVDNAVKYSEPQSLFEINVERSYSSWLIKFKNSGIRLNEEARNNVDIVFQKGRRCFDLDTSTISGDGLGLYISRTLALAYGGDLWLEYRDGKPWSEFVFILSFPLWYDTKIKQQNFL